MSHAQDLAIELAVTRGTIKRLKEREDELVQSLAAEMEFDVLVVDGVGAFERRVTRPRKNWDSEEIKIDLYRKLSEIPRMVAPSTGQIESEAEAFGRVLFECARPEWRVTGLKKYDLDPDEYCVTEPGHYTIQMTTTR